MSHVRSAVTVLSSRRPRESPERGSVIDVVGVAFQPPDFTLDAAEVVLLLADFNGFEELFCGPHCLAAVLTVLF